MRVLYNPLRKTTSHIVSEMRIKPDIKIALSFTSKRSCVRAPIDLKNKNVHLNVGPHPYGPPLISSPRCYKQHENRYLPEIKVGLNLLLVGYIQLLRYALNVVKDIKADIYATVREVEVNLAQTELVYNEP